MGRRRRMKGRAKLNGRSLGGLELSIEGEDESQLRRAFCSCDFEIIKGFQLLKYCNSTNVTQLFHTEPIRITRIRYHRLPRLQQFACQLILVRFSIHKQ